MDVRDIVGEGRDKVGEGRVRAGCAGRGQKWVQKWVHIWMELERYEGEHTVQV